MLRAIIEDAAELSGLAAFVGCIAIIAAPDAAMAADGIASPGSCVAWIIPSIAGGAVAGCIACALIYMRNAVRAFGDDVAEHDANEPDWMQAESINGSDK